MTASPAPLLHLLDHRGTISRLVEPLGRLPGHQILRSFDRTCSDPVARVAEELTTYDADVVVVLHATEWRLPFRRSWDEISTLTSRSAVFMHVTPTYLSQVGCRADLVELSQYTASDQRRVVLVPGVTGAQAYRDHNVRAYPVQIGIDPPTVKDPSVGPAFTVLSSCTLSDPRYMDIKGIPDFIATVCKLGLADRSAVLGHDGPPIGGVKRISLSHDSMLATLSKGKAYVQLSNSEAYNITAIEAKMLRVPVIVTGIEGHLDNVRSGLTVASAEAATEALARTLAGPRAPSEVARVVDANYLDSQERETLLSFDRSLSRVIKVTK